MEYKGKALYSRYNPAHAAKTEVASLSFDETTLVLAFSPLLGYGLPELLSRGTFVVGVEFEKELFALTEESTSRFLHKVEKTKRTESFDTSSRNEMSEKEENLTHKRKENFSQFKADNDTKEKNIIEPNAAVICSEESQDIFPGRFILLGESEVNGFIKRLGLGECGAWRKVTSVHLSAAYLLHEEAYLAIENAVRQAVSVFWRNRLTLTHFARLYSKNFFLNLASSSYSFSFPSIKKPILIAASGEGLEKTLSFLAERYETRRNFFIISVDASLPAFREAGVMVDAVISEDAQSTVRRFFAGFPRESVKYAFCSLSSSNGAASLVAEKTCFYITCFSKASFILASPLAETAPILPPLGSVALQAVCLSDMIREDKSVPILVSGADFSFSAGKTHSRGTYFDLSYRASSTRLSPPWNYAASFLPSAFCVGHDVYSTKQLSYYANLFAASFFDMKNTFLLNSSPFSLALPYARIEDFVSFPHEENEEGVPLALSQAVFSYLKERDEEILRLKSLILRGNKTDEDEILSLMRRNEYLFLNFPDGIEASLARHFLRRVLVQIDYFRKVFAVALSSFVR